VKYPTEFETVDITVSAMAVNLCEKGGLTLTLSLTLGFREFGTWDLEF